MVTVIKLRLHSQASSYASSNDITAATCGLEPLKNFMMMMIYAVAAATDDHNDS